MSTPTAQPLEGMIAIVAGATRGGGRGIAAMLGAAGATVYCTGRSVRGHLASGINRPETIEETAEMVTAYGGHGIAVQTDHTVPEQVQALFDRIRSERGRLDLLVNDIWGGDALTAWGKPFWEHPLDDALLMIQRGLTTHLITAHHAAPLLIENRKGLIVEITDGDTYNYRGTLYYDMVKTGLIRLAFGMSRDLHAHNIAVVAVTPGYLRSEAMLDHWGVTEQNWQEGAESDPHFIASETPYFVGRAVAALAGDPMVMKKSGRVFSSWGLSDEYGFTDIDGRSPHWGRYFASAFTPLKPCDRTFYEYWFHDPMAMHTGTP